MGDQTHKQRDGPFVGAAVFCISVERRTDGAHDLIGVIDVVNLASALSPPVFQNALHLNVCLLIRPGTLTGPYALTLRGADPVGNPCIAESQVIEFTETAAPIVVSQPLAIPMRGLGVYWFDVKLNEQLLTRMSLEVAHKSPVDDEPRTNERRRKRS
jgi:hypothetical protein